MHVSDAQSLRVGEPSPLPRFGVDVPAHLQPLHGVEGLASVTAASAPARSKVSTLASLRADFNTSSLALEEFSSSSSSPQHDHPGITGFGGDDANSPPASNRTPTSATTRDANNFFGGEAIGGLHDAAAAAAAQPSSTGASVRPQTSVGLGRRGVHLRSGALRSATAEDEEQQAEVVPATSTFLTSGGGESGEFEAWDEGETAAAAPTAGVASSDAVTSALPQQAEQQEEKYSNPTFGGGASNDNLGAAAATAAADDEWPDEPHLAAFPESPPRTAVSDSTTAVGANAARRLSPGTSSSISPSQEAVAVPLSAVAEGSDASSSEPSAANSARFVELQQQHQQQRSQQPPHQTYTSPQEQLLSPSDAVIHATATNSRRNSAAELDPSIAVAPTTSSDAASDSATAAATLWGGRGPLMSPSTADSLAQTSSSAISATTTAGAAAPAFSIAPVSVAADVPSSPSSSPATQSSKPAAPAFATSTAVTPSRPVEATQPSSNTATTVDEEKKEAGPVAASSSEHVTELAAPPIAIAAELLSAKAATVAASPSPLDRLLARTSARIAADAARAAEVDAQRDAARMRTREAQAAAEAGRAHRKNLGAQLPDSHFPPAPVSAAQAGKPRVLQVASMTAPWRSHASVAPLELSQHVTRSAIDWRTVPASTEAVVPSASYDRAAASFAQFLKSGLRAPAPAKTATPQRFGALDLAERTRILQQPYASGNSEEQRRPGAELLEHGLSARAKELVKRTAEASRGLDARLDRLPSRRHHGAFETPEAVNTGPAAVRGFSTPAMHARLADPTLKALLAAKSGSGSRSAGFGGEDVSQLGLSARARALALGHVAGGLAAATAAPAGTGIARLQDRAADDSKRVALLRLAWREREAEQAALSAGMSAAAAEAKRLERQQDEVMAIHAALQRREAAERARFERGGGQEDGDDFGEWAAPPTEGQDAGFYSAFERERLARATMERLVHLRSSINKNSGDDAAVPLSPRSQQIILQRGADAEAYEQGGADDLEAAALRALRGSGGDAEVDDSVADMTARSIQYDENGYSLPPTPRDVQRTISTAVRHDEQEEKYPVPAAAAAAAGNDASGEAHPNACEISPGRVFVRPQNYAFRAFAS
jgi:hypothetical protein